ncbi:unnamed protein product [Urochloa humidicola]
MSGVQVSAGASDSPAVVLEPPQQQLLQEVTVNQFSPEAVDGTITSEVVLAPPQQQQGQTKVTVTQFSPEAVDEIIRRYKAFPKSETEELDEMRGWFMVLATLTASITYSAALNPPGGVWQDDGDDKKRHVAGDPVFRDKRPGWYNVFYWSNLISFMLSLLIIVILSIPKIFNMSKMKMCNVIVVFDIASLVVAFTSGSARHRMDYVYVGMLPVLVFGIIMMAKIIERRSSRMHKNVCP